MEFYQNHTSSRGAVLADTSMGRGGGGGGWLVVYLGRELEKKALLFLHVC